MTDRRSMMTDELPTLKQLCALLELQCEVVGYRDLKPKLDEAIGVLESIAKNTCCDKCQEAAIVAQDALARMGAKTPSQEYDAYLAEGASVIR